MIQKKEASLTPELKKENARRAGKKFLFSGGVFKFF